MGKIAIKTNATADISSILPEVLRFYDATATSTITKVLGNENISSWGDRSVNNIAAIQTVSNQQPIYNPITGTINMSSTRNFQINFGTNAFSGTVYIADADHGVLDFSISVGANTILNVWSTTNSSAFVKVIGIVITSNPNHRSIIENYFGSKSQNLKYSNATSFNYLFWINESNNNLFACRVTSFPLLNTQNVTNMQETWRRCSSLTSFPLLNTQNVTHTYLTWFECTSLISFPVINLLNATNIEYTWYGCERLTSFPLIDISKATTIAASWNYNISLTTFPPLNTQNVTSFYDSWGRSYSLSSFPAINTTKGTNFNNTWQSCPLTSLSVDNILISIAAGFANNINKTIDVTGILLGSSGAGLSHTNRRPTTNDSGDTQDTISNWNAIINNYLSGGINLTEMRNQLADAINTYNNKWKSWEQLLRSTNESLNGVQYNFSNGTVSGQKARFWILAKKSLTIPLAAPTNLTTEVTRSYRSNSGLTVTNSNVVDAWTPVTLANNQTSNQTITNLTTQTINGITCVMFSDTKTITLNSINVTNATVYIGTLYGYVKRISITATNLKISTDTTTELPIISIMVTTTAVDEYQVLLRLGFYGSFQEFNYAATNGLTSSNIQLASV